MKTEFQAKFLQHMMKKKQEKGFTLIELLVVIIIIGILSAIALPSFLNQANKAKQSEAKQNAGSLNRAQQAYYLENSAFGSTVENLGLGIVTQTTNYNYTLDPAIVTNSNQSYVVNLARSRKAPLRGYAGRVDLGTVTATSEATTLAVLCETIKPGIDTVATTTVSSATSPPDCATTDSKKLDAK